MQAAPVVVQPQQAVPTTNLWSTGVCGCFDDIGICLCGLCVPCILGCQVAAAMNENCCVPNCLHGGLLAMRTKLRMEHNIGGSICNDWCVVSCCVSCALCQIARELKHQGAM